MNLHEEPAHTRPKRPFAGKPITTTIDDTCRMTGLGRTKVYELIAEGKLRSVSVGRRRLVIYESIKALLEPASA